MHLYMLRVHLMVAIAKNFVGQVEGGENYNTTISMVINKHEEGPPPHRGLLDPNSLSVTKGTAAL